MKHLIYLSILLAFLLSSCDKDSNIGPIADEIEIPKRDVELKFITYSNSNNYGLSSNPVIYNSILTGNVFSSDTNWWNKRIKFKHDTFYKYYYADDSINFAFFNAAREYNLYDTTNVRILFKDSIIWSVNEKARSFPNPSIIKVIIPKK